MLDRHTDDINLIFFYNFLLKDKLNMLITRPFLVTLRTANFYNDNRPKSQKSCIVDVRLGTKYGSAIPPISFICKRIMSVV